MNGKSFGYLAKKTRNPPIPRGCLPDPRGHGPRATESATAGGGPGRFCPGAPGGVKTRTTAG
eukprot:9578-Lingulodinium_polyedra.AAC.1